MLIRWVIQEEFKTRVANTSEAFVQFADHIPGLFTDAKRVKNVDGEKLEDVIVLEKTGF